VFSVQLSVRRAVLTVVDHRDAKAGPGRGRTGNLSKLDIWILRA